MPLGASLLLAACLARGQSSVPSEVRLQAIVGARIEVGDGRVLDKGTVVIRDGIIVAVEADAPVPAGAQILDGKGLTLLPGFIDAWTNKGTAPPEAKPEQDDAAPAAEFASASMREANRKGVRPDLQARTCLSLSDDMLRAYREAGFTSAMIVPPGGYIAGIGTLINLSGRPARNCVVIPQTAMAIDFDGEAVGNGYPGSLLGRIAQVRQAFEDARTVQAITMAFRSGANNRRPPSDPVLESLFPALNGSLESMIEADTPAQIDRALSIAKEYRLKPILVGGLQAYKRVDQIKASKPGLILGLNFGEEPKKPDPPKPDETTDDTPPDPIEAIAERSRLYNEAARNAVVLREAGILFALSTHGSKDVGEFMSRLRTAVKNGLPRQVVLSALTVDAARILKVQRSLGMISVGKTANLTAFTGDFLDEKTKVKMIYIDGRRIDPESKPLPPAPNGAPAIKDLP